MADVINYWPDPDFRTTNRTAPWVAFNMFPNPTPTVDLTNWSAVTTTTRTNLCTNPSMQSTIGGWDNPGSHCTLSSSTLKAFKGDKSLKVVHNSSQAPFQSGTGWILSLTAGQTVTFSVWVWVASGTVSPVLQAQRPFYTYNTSGGVAAYNSWQRLSVTFTADTTTTHYLYVVNQATIASGAIWYVDAALVEVAGSALDYFDGDTPGASWTGTAHASTSTIAGGSITRTSAAALFPENSYGCRVVNGVKLTGSTDLSWSQDWTFTGRVRASSAMTITISGAMLDPTQTFITRAVGWGSFGWGEELDYTPGASYTFAAGEERVFRIYCGENTSTDTAGAPHNVVVSLTGTGTFDVDGITQSIGVGDGVGDGATDSIPDAPLFFSGDTPDDENFTYSWYGTPHASTSIQTALVPKYVWSSYDFEYNDDLPLVPEAAFAVVKDGEHRVAYRSEMQHGRNSLVLTNGIIPEVNPYNTAGFTVPAGNYALTFDFVSDYQNYYYGYAEPEWQGGSEITITDVGPDAPAYPANRQSSMHINGFPPYRRRMIMPFTATATSVIQPELSSGMNWVSGDVYMTNVGVFEIEEILHMDAYLPTNVEGIWDFTAMGVDAGKSYHLHVWADAANSHPLVESRVGTGSWTTLAESTLGTLVEPIQITAESLSFTVPADATEVRLRLVNPGTNVWCDLFTAPPEFFDGDTPDAGGYTYSWEGTAYDSRSIRSDVPTGPTAQAWVAGTARNVTEMRVVVDGTLVPVTQAGA